MRKKLSGSIAETVRQLAEPLADSLGLTLWDVTYGKEGARYYLRVTVDKEDGVTIDDCEAMHRALDPVLDEADPIEDSYYLEVSSPGVERELKTDAHILACTGWDVEVRLYAPLDGVKVFEGVLAGLDEDGRLCLDTPAGERRLERDKIAKLATVYHFD